jgi:ABC-type phosphate transport system substrate-binding protein
MKIVKYLSIVALLLVPFAAQLNAQTLQAAIAGSSALWLETGQGVYNGNGGTSGACIWTETTSGAAYVTDTRPSVGLTESGNTWVVWTLGGGLSCSSPGTSSQVYFFISLDSTIGNRCLFAQPQCTFTTTASVGDAGHNPDKLGFADTALPSGVLSAINGASINISATDIPPTDSKFATYQALAVCGPLSSGTQYQGYGYGPGPVGASILSSYSSKSFHVVDFNIVGSDPITGTAIPAFAITPVGAAPVVVVVNTLNSNGFGASGVTNLDRATLALMYSGILVRTADAIPQPFAGLSSSYSGITALSRESLSGTYNTFDRSIPNNKEIYRPQETGNCTSGSYGVNTNPLNLTRTISQGGTSTTGTHTRVIGTSEMISEVQAVQDSIGYAFWSAANFNGVSNIKYLTVDGVDPLQNTYTGGTLPQGAALANVTLAHVADGSYPIWSEQRFVSYAGGLAAAQQISSWAQAQVSFGTGATQPDWVTAPNLNVFHMHFNLPFITDQTASDGPRVCGAGAAPEAGGDAGGLVLTLQAGGDYCVLKGNYGAGGVGPTNTASFGSHE